MISPRLSAARRLAARRGLPENLMAARFLQSTIGKKAVMAVTGLVLVGFVLGHMLGNLQLFLPMEGGEHPLDAYGRTLHTMLHGGGLWIARLVLLGSIAAHIWAALTLTQLNQKARPVGYRALEPQASTMASRTMRVSGIVVLVFIVFHLLHFTVGAVHPSFKEGKVFANVVSGFQVPWVSLFYVVAMFALAPHLRHGVWSIAQSLGLSHPRYDKLRNPVATGITLLIVGANISFPVAVLAGLVR